MGELFKKNVINQGGGSSGKSQNSSLRNFVPLTALGQSIIVKNSVGISGAIEKTNFPKNGIPPVGGNCFSGNL